MSNGALILGITRHNVELMKQGKPLVVRHEEVGDTTGDIVMIYAEDMQQLQKQLAPLMDPRTKITGSDKSH